MPDFLSVSTLTKYLKMKFERDPYLERVYLTGQVSNFRRRPSHQYFSLKDDGAVIQATMWAGVYKKLGFDLEEGMKINVVGRVQLYEPGGSYSIVIERAEPDGIGALAVQFEQLKKKLTDEGLFKAEFKQVIPQFAKKIGVITSPSGAVIQDIITTVSRRFPGVEIVLYPTKVQGEGAAQEVAANLARANEREDLDVLIVGRGGGSIEDLWAFNEEVVVRAIFESRIPVISSVGHETDTTLADFVADQRAATPTAAAELATPVTKMDLLQYLQASRDRLGNALQHRIRFQAERLRKVVQSVIFRQPERLYDAQVQRVDLLSQRLQQAMRSCMDSWQQSQSGLENRLLLQTPQRRVESGQETVSRLTENLSFLMDRLLERKQSQVSRLSESLMLLDTSRIVARGYALLERDGKALSSVQGVKKQDRLTVSMKDGQLEVEVKDVKERNV